MLLWKETNRNLEAQPLRSQPRIQNEFLILQFHDDARSALFCHHFIVEINKCCLLLSIWGNRSLKKVVGISTIVNGLWWIYGFAEAVESLCRWI